jgi:hypothetical protein
MSKIHTDTDFLERLRRASASKPQQDQRISFILGSLPEESNMTREQVEQVLERRTA